MFQTRFYGRGSQEAVVVQDPTRDHLPCALDDIAGGAVSDRWMLRVPAEV